MLSNINIERNKNIETRIAYLVCIIRARYMYCYTWYAHIW